MKCRRNLSASKLSGTGYLEGVRTSVCFPGLWCHWLDQEDYTAVATARSTEEPGRRPRLIFAIENLLESARWSEWENRLTLQKRLPARADTGLTLSPRPATGKLKPGGVLFLLYPAARPLRRSYKRARLRVIIKLIKHGRSYVGGGSGGNVREASSPDKVDSVRKVCPWVLSFQNRTFGKSPQEFLPKPALYIPPP